MAGKDTQFEQMLAEEIRKYKGVCVPVKSSLPRRLLVRKAWLGSLHPNPEDEFCDPEIGPNYEIIAGYEQEYLRFRRGPYIREIQNSGKYEPLTVERMRPNGYMILNGHHRWAAAMRAGRYRLPIRIVNLTREEDIRRILAASEHSRRATLDLDEVVFCGPGDAADRKPAFPWNLIYKQPMRLGVPALTRFLQRRGYDVWVYSTEYHSQDEIEHYLRSHQVQVTGIVTGVARKVSKGIRKEMEALISGHYPETVHIDGQSVVRTRSGDKAFEEHTLSGDTKSWSREVMEVFEGFAGKAEKQP